MVFDNRVGTLVGEGPLNIGSDLRYMKIKAAGRIKTDYNKPDSLNFKVTAELMTGMEIIFPKAVMDILINDIRAAGFDAIPAAYNTNQPFYQSPCPNSSATTKTSAKPSTTSRSIRSLYLKNTTNSPSSSDAIMYSGTKNINHSSVWTTAFPWSPSTANP